MLRHGQDTPGFQGTAYLPQHRSSVIDFAEDRDQEHEVEDFRRERQAFGNGDDQLTPGRPGSYEPPASPMQHAQLSVDQHELARTNAFPYRPGYDPGTSAEIENPHPRSQRKSVEDTREPQQVLPERMLE